MKNLLGLITALLLTTATFAQTARTTTSSSVTERSTSTSTDSNYSMSASFSRDKFEKIKTSLFKNLGKPTKDLEDIYFWNLKSVYTVTLQPKGIMIELDKTNAPAEVVKNFEVMDKELQAVFSGKNK